MDARGLQSHVGRARLIALRPTKRAKSKEQEPLFSSPPPNPAFEGTRGYAVVCFLGVRPPAPLNSGVGRVSMMRPRAFFCFLDNRRILWRLKNSA